MPQWMLVCLLLFPLVNCSEHSEPGIEIDTFDKWVVFEPEGAVCANGTPYKYFVRFANPTNNPEARNLALYFEPGGGCWDFESCMKENGVRGAANTACVRDRTGEECIPDDHADTWFRLPSELTIPEELEGVAANYGIVNGRAPVDVVIPLLSDNEEINPMANWTKVFLPYCTGDVFTGNKVVTYEDPTGIEEPVTFHHVGHKNTLAVIDDLNRIFGTELDIPKMMVSGCSAGGTGALTNYYFLRTGLPQVQNGYMIDDAGPIFPDAVVGGVATPWSGPLHNEVRVAWDAQSLIESVPEFSPLQWDLGNINSVLAEQFPDDRLAMAWFQQDYDYSLYSYERFYDVDPSPERDGLDADRWDHRAIIYQYWQDDTALLMDQIKDYDNMGYFFPRYRTTNDSHCITVPGIEDALVNYDDTTGFLADFVGRPSQVYYTGSELPTDSGDIDFLDFLHNVLDDTVPLLKEQESGCEGRYQACTPDCYDAEKCRLAVEEHESLCTILSGDEAQSYDCHYKEE